MSKIHLRDVRLDQTIHFSRSGSIRGGTIKSGADRLEVAIEIDADETPERIAELVRVAKESCFTHSALAQPVPVETTLSLNGQTLA
jgi:uncharacterized OsmC-like protein